jgi:hypothetical protein
MAPAAPIFGNGFQNSRPDASQPLVGARMAPDTFNWRANWQTQPRQAERKLHTFPEIYAELSPPRRLGHWFASWFA